MTFETDPSRRLLAGLCGLVDARRPDRGAGHRGARYGGVAAWPAAGLVHHSGHGSQYASLAFTARLAEVGGVASMGSVGDALDTLPARAASGR